MDKPLMIRWCEERGWLEYQQALTTLCTKLGVSGVDFLQHPELSPYTTRILQYLANELIRSGSEDLATLCQTVFDVFDRGAGQIIYDQAEQLARDCGVIYDVSSEWCGQREPGIDDDDEWQRDSSENENRRPTPQPQGDNIEGDVLDDDGEIIEPGHIDETDGWVEWNRDRFVFSWTNLLTALCLRLRWQYASLLRQPTSQGCPCECGSGETTQHWESYQSGVWPDDEECRSWNYTSGSSWRSTSSTVECTCGYRLKNNF